MDRRGERHLGFGRARFANPCWQSRHDRSTGLACRSLQLRQRTQRSKLRCPYLVQRLFQFRVFLERRLQIAARFGKPSKPEYSCGRNRRSRLLEQQLAIAVQLVALLKGALQNL